MDKDFYYLGRTKISVTSIAETLKLIHQCIEEKRSAYICIANLRTAIYAHYHYDYRLVVNNAFLNTPDGMPLVWGGKIAGKNIERTCGPDLFKTSLMFGEKGKKHFLLGDTKDTLEKLIYKIEKEYQSQVVGSFSPEFVDSYTKYNFEHIAELINHSGAEIVWVALGAPKQDLFAAKLVQLLNDGIVVVGVGAAFRFVLGEYKDPPKVFKKMALTGLFWRAKNHPLKSFFWYIKHSLLLVYFLFIVLLNRFFRLKIYYEE